MRQVQTLCITAQQKAYVERRKVYVNIQDSILVDEVEYGIPKDIACESVSFYYNAKGNMSKAFSFHCSNTNTKMKLVFQVGAGRVRLEKEYWLFITGCVICVICDSNLFLFIGSRYINLVFSKGFKNK